MISGDTRFDRVAEIAAKSTNLPLIMSFCSDRTLIAGSTWPEDEALLKEWIRLQQGWKLMIVPHEITPTHLTGLRQQFPNAKFFSEVENLPSLADFSILIIDRMGWLSQLYRYATLCYVGGGLKKSGHHNILEAAVYGKAIVTGPHIEKFSESVALNKLGGSFMVKEGKDLYAITTNPEIYLNAGEKASSFVQSNLGATEKIMRWMEESGLLKK
jgi:3-deoxy-D-manno-octulosonic-acid transferase